MVQRHGTHDRLIAIVGNVTTSRNAKAAAEDLGKALAKAGFRIVVYSSGDSFLERYVVTGYVAGQMAKPASIQVRYPLHGEKPEFDEQQTHAQLFDWRPDSQRDWEVSFYQSLQDASGVVLIGGGDSTLIAGLMARGYRLAVLALPTFKGRAMKVWESLQPGRDLPSADEISMMARPQWSADLAAECAKSLQAQLARRAEEDRQRRAEEMRRETSITLHAAFALVVFVCALGSIPLAWTANLELVNAIALLFFSPMLAGVAGSTIRLVLDLRERAVPLSRQSVITTSALGLIAGGVAGTMFIAAQVNIMDQSQIPAHAGKLVPFGVAVGFIAGLTLDAVFRKLMATDVVDLSGIDSSRP